MCYVNLTGLSIDVSKWHFYFYYFNFFLLKFRQLEGEIADEWASTEEKDKLLGLVESIIKFDMEHNAEIQACDLLMEIDRLDMLDKHMDMTNYSRVCLYLIK